MLGGTGRQGLGEDGGGEVGERAWDLKRVLKVGQEPQVCPSRPRGCSVLSFHEVCSGGGEDSRSGSALGVMEEGV